MKKIRVGLIFGGRSGEHEVSMISAGSIARNLDPAKYDLHCIYITPEGRWTRGLPLALPQPGEPLRIPVIADQTRDLSQGGVSGVQGLFSKVDVFFPVLHGTEGEDGTVQGLLELSNVPYVGCGVLASAVGMDKRFAKRLVQAAGMRVVPWIDLEDKAWQSNKKGCLEKVRSAIQDWGYPVFVKPSNSGSSVGVYKVKATEDLESKIEAAFSYDRYVLIEKGMEAREIELSVLEDPMAPESLVSVPGEVTPAAEFYSYESKYIDQNGASFAIPAKLSEEQKQEATQMARNAFLALNGEGMARIDLFLTKKDSVFYFNEMNSIPGFTSISMYPKMWEASGLNYSSLIEKLLHLAILRHERKAALNRVYDGGAKLLEISQKPKD